MNDAVAQEAPIPLLVDLHTDALYEHIQGRKDITQRSDKGHLDFPRMKEGGVNGQVFAVWVSPTDMTLGAGRASLAGYRVMTTLRTAWAWA